MNLPVEIVELPAPALSDSEMARLESLKTEIRGKCPEFFKILREFVDAGLVRGLRDVTYYGPTRPNPRCAIKEGRIAIATPMPDNIADPDSYPKIKYR